MGPRQYPEKLIPKCIDSIKSGKKIPLHGDGSYVRDWIHVEDNVSGIWYVLEYGENRNVYNISGNNPLSNIEVVKQVCSWFDIDDYKSHVEFVENRLGQDARYSINSAKAENLCWSREFGKGLTNYVKH
jgi:dTDP-glucose 4,6-dehydratase